MAEIYPYALICILSLLTISGNIICDIELFASSEIKTLSTQKLSTHNIRKCKCVQDLIFRLIRDKMHLMFN